MSPSHEKLGMNPSHEKLDMNRSRQSGWLRLAGALVLLGAVPFAESAPAGDAPAPLVPLYVVGQEEELLAIPGTVQAARRSELAFQFGGLLVERPVVAGQRVTAGTVLARLDPRDFEARLSLEQSRLNLARANYERFSRLRGSRTSPVSDAEVDRSRSLFEIAEVSTAQARKNLQDTTLRAPFDGVVAVVLVDNHTQIRARQPIVTVEAADVLEVIIDLPERVVARVRTVPRDQPVGEVEFAVLPARRFPVTLGEIATRADPATQTFRVTLALERPRDVNLLPGHDRHRLRATRSRRGCCIADTRGGDHSQRLGAGRRVGGRPGRLPHRKTHRGVTGGRIPDGAGAGRAAAGRANRQRRRGTVAGRRSHPALSNRHAERIAMVRGGSGRPSPA
jgi:RND family efflux transporter MFP subunit